MFFKNIVIMTTLLVYILFIKDKIYIKYKSALLFLCT